MVQLLIRLSDSAGEWGLIELQGQLETRHQVPFDSMHLGDLHFDTKVCNQIILYACSLVCMMKVIHCRIIHTEVIDIYLC